MKKLILLRKKPLPILFISLCLIVILMPIIPSTSVYSSSDTLNITLVGDLFLGNWIEEYIQKDPSYPFLHITSILGQSDLLIGNLEAPLSLKGEVYVEKTYTLHCHPQAVQVLTAGGFDAVTLANNHIMDFGPSALMETIAVLTKHNIKYAGAGADINQARTPAYLEKRGFKIALLAYNNTLPLEFNASNHTPGTAQGRWEYIEADIKKAKAAADLVIVSFHWSAELLKEPKPYQRSLARLSIDSGADLVFGHHPHVIQGIEIYKNRVIAYSLGNFIFSSYSKKVKDSIILQVRMAKDGPREVTIFPINVDNHQVVFRPKPLTGHDAILVLEELSALSSKFGTRIKIHEDRGEIIF
ncbi:MAG TPA: CapA family protein [Firmicutes bacterium]|nr:CapA family protein [Bacillota bacterium]